jgi:hypothetical protein
VPHYHFSAGSMKVVNKDVLVARNVTLSFGDVPVFWLPFFMQSLKQGRRSGILTPNFSINDIVRRNSRYNRRISNVGVYWATSEHFGAQLAMDWYANNWTALEGSLDYRFLEQFLDGRATVRRFWQESGSRDFTISANNGWQPDERTSIRVDGQYATSTAFIRQSSFDPRELNRSIDSNAGLSRQFDWGSISLQASRRQQLTDSRVDMTLPSLGLNLKTVTFGPLTWTGSAQTRFTSTDIDPFESPAEVDRHEVNGSAASSFTLGQLALSQSFDLRDSRFDPRPETRDSAGKIVVEEKAGIITRTGGWNTNLSYQQRLIGTTTLTPGVAVRGAFQRDSLTGKLVSSPMRLDLNATLKADLFGFFPGVGSVQQIRHRLSPSFTYNYSPAIRPDSGTAQGRLFADSAREQNRLTIQFNQTFEAKLRQSDKEKAAADSAGAIRDTLNMDPNQPRRLPQSPKITLLSLNTDAVVYDFVQARDHLGVQTTEISNSVNSDLLRGFQLSITHDLFRRLPVDTTVPVSQRRVREFSPHLTRVSASFSLSGSAGIFRMLGLARAKQPEAPVATGSQPTPVPEAAQAGPPTDPTRGGLDLMGNRARPQLEERPSSPVGSWNASLNYTLFRPRAEQNINGVNQNLSGENQMVTANVTFQPTQNWNVAWNTGYSFTESHFTDHVLTLTRQMHDWDAHFDFVKAQNGNFSFQFRVSLRANPDIKFDYEQRDRRNPTTIR